MASADSLLDCFKRKRGGEKMPFRLFISQEDVELLDKAPVTFVDLHAVDLLLTPVSGVDLLSFGVVNGGHLVTENFNNGLLGQRHHISVLNVEQVRVFEHAGTIASKNDDVVITCDSDTTSLADWEFVSRIDQVPFGVLDTILESFNSAEVLFSLIVDSAEDIDELVSKTAG